MTIADRTAQTSLFTLKRILDATPEEAFRAWTDPEYMGWYFNDTMPVPDEAIEVDLRVGGLWRQMMVIDDETRFFTGGLYLEIDPPHRLVFAQGATDGWPRLDPENLDETPVVTVTLSPVREGDRTRTEMSLEVRLPEGMSEQRARDLLALPMEQGWNDTIDRLVVTCRRD